MTSSYERLFRKDLKEMKKDMVRNRRYIIKWGDEAINLIDELLENPNQRAARKLYNRMMWLGTHEDIAEFVMSAVKDKFYDEEEE